MSPGLLKPTNYGSEPNKPSGFVISPKFGNCVNNYVCQWRRSGVFIVNFEHISHIFLVFLMLTLNKQMLARKFNIFDSYCYLRHCTSFWAVAVYTFNWPVVNLFQKLGWIVWLTAPAFSCDRWKRKGNIESIVRKVTMESIVHETWKEYGITMCVFWCQNKLIYSLVFITF